MRVLELCSGTGIVSDAFRARGHHAVTVDLEGADVNGNVKDMRVVDGLYDFVWASPPCDKYCGLPWLSPREPDLGIWGACEDIGLRSPYFVIENSVFARRYHGKETKRCGTRYLWGRFPPFYCERPPPKSRHRDPKLRAMIPAQIYEPLIRALEQELTSVHRC